MSRYQTAAPYVQWAPDVGPFAKYMIMINTKEEGDNNMKKTIKKAAKKPAKKKAKATKKSKK